MTAALAKDQRVLLDELRDHGFVLGKETKRGQVWVDTFGPGEVYIYRSSDWRAIANGRAAMRRAIAQRPCAPALQLGQVDRLPPPLFTWTPEPEPELVELEPEPAPPAPPKENTMTTPTKTDRAENRRSYRSNEEIPPDTVTAVQAKKVRVGDFLYVTQPRTGNVTARRVTGIRQGKAGQLTLEFTSQTVTVAPDRAFMRRRETSPGKPALVPTPIPEGILFEDDDDDNNN